MLYTRPQAHRLPHSPCRWLASWVSELQDRTLPPLVAPKLAVFDNPRAPQGGFLDHLLSKGDSLGTREEHQLANSSCAVIATASTLDPDYIESHIQSAWQVGRLVGWSVGQLILFEFLMNCFIQRQPDGGLFRIFHRHMSSTIRGPAWGVCSHGATCHAP